MKKSLIWLLRPGSLLSLSLMVGCALGSLSPMQRTLPPLNSLRAPHRIDPGRQVHNLSNQLNGPNLLGGTSRSLKREVENPENIKAWPLAEHSPRFPLSVRYQLAGDKAMAQKVLAI
ncbi:MAG: hypothetical protein ACAI44_09275, partial [Candidatus Sericytochromatia bacterium]